MTVRADPESWVLHVTGFSVIFLILARVNLVAS